MTSSLYSPNFLYLCMKTSINSLWQTVREIVMNGRMEMRRGVQVWEGEGGLECYWQTDFLDKTNALWRVNGFALLICHLPPGGRLPGSCPVLSPPSFDAFKLTAFIGLYPYVHACSSLSHLFDSLSPHPSASWHSSFSEFNPATLIFLFPKILI